MYPNNMAVNVCITPGGVKKDSMEDVPMKKSMLAAAVLAALMVPQVVGAESFGITEWSTEGVAMGGARMFAENDPAAIASNPAGLTKIKGKILKVTATYISPHDKFKCYDGLNGTGNTMGGDANGDNKNVVRPAWAPGTYFARQMDEKNWMGMGTFARFGLASQFERSSVASYNAFFSKMEGISITPVLAHKFDQKWSGAVGADINYVGLQMEKNAAAFGGAPTQLKGRSYALGWNAAVNYAFDDKNEFGVVYRSKIKHSLLADFKAFHAYSGMDIGGKAYGVVTLPDQWSIGYGHKFDDKNRVELNALRTNWNTYDALNIHLSNLSVHTPMGSMPMGMDIDIPNPKAFSYNWRYGIGFEHRFSEKYLGMLGFAYDRNSNHSGDFVVPTGNRRTYTAGVRYEDSKQAVAFAAGWMKLGDLTWNGGPTDVFKSAHTRDNYVKMFSVGYEYKF